MLDQLSHVRVVIFSPTCINMYSLVQKYTVHHLCWNKSRSCSHLFTYMYKYIFITAEINIPYIIYVGTSRVCVVIFSPTYINMYSLLQKYTVHHLCWNN